MNNIIIYTHTLHFNDTLWRLSQAKWRWWRHDAFTDLRSWCDRRRRRQPPGSSHPPLPLLGVHPSSSSRASTRLCTSTWRNVTWTNIEDVTRMSYCMMYNHILYATELYMCIIVCCCSHLHLWSRFHPYQTQWTLLWPLVRCLPCSFYVPSAPETRGSPSFRYLTFWGQANMKLAAADDVTRLIKCTARVTRCVICGVHACG